MSEAVVMSSFRRRRFVVAVSLIALLATISAGRSGAADPPSAVAPLMRLLQSGRLPPERRGTVLEMICTRGGPDDLAFVLGHAAAADVEPGLRLRILELLTDAATTRKVKPSGELSAIEKLLAPGHDAKLRLAAVGLAAVWKVPNISDELQAIAIDASSDLALRRAAIDGLAAVADAEAQSTLRRIAESAGAGGLRSRAAAAVAKFDLDGAASLAAQALPAATDEEAGALVDAFLTRKGGPDKLAAALESAPPPTDAAKMALRYMYSVGRSDARLSAVLSKAAGVAVDPQPPTPAELQALLAEVAEKGDAARGEKVFRRADLSCMKCHALGRAGGQVGPDLSAIGSISPVDYVANSILNPNLAIKEQFVTRVIVTDDGQTFTGIVVDRDDVRVRLKDASGKIVTIPTADIDEEEEGKSLMPQGLTKFLTRQELIDVVKFISELGRPGRYAIRTTPTIQRWRVFKPTAAELRSEVPNVEIFRQQVLAAPAEAWTAAYGMADGSLPLGELGAPGDVVYVQGEIEVVQAGAIDVKVTADAPPAMWFDAEPFDAAAPARIEADRGRHKVTFRIVVRDVADASIKVEVSKPAGSKAQFDAVGGS